MGRHTHTHTERKRERELSENERGSLASDKVVKCCISKDICHTNTESTDRQIYLERSRRVPAWMCVCVCVCDPIGPASPVSDGPR